MKSDVASAIHFQGGKEKEKEKRKKERSLRKKGGRARIDVQKKKKNWDGEEKHPVQKNNNNKIK